MKRPYSGESWTRFKELMQKLTKRTAIVETRAKNNEDNIDELQSKFDPVLQPEDGGTGWAHGLNSGINIVPGTSSEWSEWIAPAYNGTNKEGVIIKNPVSYPDDKQIGDVYTRYIEIEFDNVTATSGQPFGFVTQGSYNTSEWSNSHLVNPFTYAVNLKEPPENGVYRYASTFTVTAQEYLTAENFRITSRCDNWASGRFRFRCLKIERGYVDYPKWTPAPEDITKINDMTTGINLIRGSRKFIRGVKSIPGVKDNLKYDGLGTSSPTWTIIDGGENEFSILHTTGLATGPSYQFLNGILPEQVNGNTITCSLEFMIEDLGTTDYRSLLQLLIVEGDKDVQSLRTVTYDLIPGLNRSTIEIGKWYKIVYQYDNVLNLTENQILRIGLMSADGGRIINYRKPKIEIGHIENPIWSASPFDVDHINDETVGINLMRGTRDFLSGNDVFGAYRTDGFNISQHGVLLIDEDGFTNATVKPGTTQAIVYYQVAKQKTTPNELYTFSYEFKLDNPSDWTGTEAFGYWTIQNSSNTTIVPGFSSTSTINNSGYVVDNLEKDKWYKVVQYFSTPSVIPEGYHLRGGTNVPKPGVSFRKLCLLKGHINNPIWSASPFDIDHINDKTTGINLLRGTRDFSVSSDYVYGSATSYAKSGFNTISPFTTSIDEEGFTVLSIDRTGLSENHLNTVNASAVPCKVGDDFTLGVEFKTRDLSGIDGGDFISTIIAGKDKADTLESFSVNGVNTKVENNKWTQLVVHMRVTAADAAYIFVRLRIGKNGNLNFRKLCLYKGYINNPIWSASPFDVTSSYASVRYNIASLLTLNQGWSVQMAYLIMDNRTVTLDFLFRHTDAKKAGDLSNIATFDNSLLPDSSAFFCSPQGNGWLYRGTKQLQIKFIADVAANGDIRLGGTYVLPNGQDPINAINNLELPGGQVSIPIQDTSTLL